MIRPFILLLITSSLAAIEPVKTHPRILFRAEDMQSLRDRMDISNEVWTTFKTEIVDKCLRDYKCSATSHYTGAPNYQWIRDSFVDENGGTHLPADSDWASTWSDQTGRPAAPEDDDGNGSSYTRVNSEQYAMIFALMARLLKDQGQEVQRNEYLNAAKDCLFHVIDHAKDGHPAPDAEGHYPPFQHIGFAVDDRSFSAESFAFAVDWIYEDLTADELAKVRKAFLVWAQDCNDHIYFAPTSPHGTPNSPSLLRLSDPYQQQTRAEIRLGLNNHYTNHLREMVLYALALDPKDDIPNATHNDTATPGSLTSHIISGSPTNWLRQQFGVLYDSMSVWQYIADYALRNDGAGGISMEGTQYASNGLGPLALMLAGLNSAGQDDVQSWGPQAATTRHPFWNTTVAAYLAQLTPTSRVPTGPNLGYLGPIYQPPISGDLENFLAINDQFIKVLGPMALIDARVNGTNSPVAQAVRYIQRNLAPGGPAKFLNRIAETRGGTRLRDAVYYFLLFDPTAAAPSDPRPALQPKTFFSQHTVNNKLMGMVLGRSGYGASDTYFHWRLDWNRIDHQRGDSLGFGLWKNGLWLTNGMTGYGTLQGCSDYRNSLSLQNGVPTSSPVGEDTSAEHGSQWCYSPIGDPEITARSTGDSFLYFTGDATNLYNHQQQTQLREIEHASRSIVWLKPDHVIVYDRAKSKSVGFYKKFFLNVPRDPVIVGNVARSSAMEGPLEKGRVFVTSLLPVGSTIQWKTIDDGQPSGGIDSITGRPSYEDMWAQVFVEAPGAPQDARFLHVVQGTDAGVTNADATQVITSSDGEFEGSVVGSRCIVFRKTLGSAPAALSYTHPAGITAHYITGLAPFAGFNVTQTSTSVALTANGTQRFADGGGVLVLGGVEVPNVEITATDNSGSEGGDAISFTIKRSGDPSTTLDVTLNLNTELSTASAADLVSLPSLVSFATGETKKTITLSPFDDALFEGSETLVLRLLDGVGYHVAEVSAEAEATLSDNDSPPGGTFALSAMTYTVNENVGEGKALITVQRSGGTTGSIGVTCTATAGTAADGVQFVASGSMLTFADGETSKTFEVTILNNVIYHGDKTVLITVSQVSGVAQIGSPSAATLTILDDEPAPVGDISFATASYGKAEGDPSFTITLRRLNGTGGNVSATIAAQGGSTALAGSDFTISPTIVSWADHDGADKIVTFTVIDDSLYEGGSESVTLGLISFTGGVTAGSPSSTTITIADNDAQPSVLEVGPGKARTTLADVSWSNLVAGSTVLVYPKPGGYHERVQLSASGTASEPIRIIGVTVNGEKPLLDGANATTPSSLQFASFEFIESAALWTVRRRSSQASNVKPGYLVIENFAFTNTGPNQTYLDTSSNAQNYSSTGAALFIAGAEHIMVRKCSFTNSMRGVSVRSGSTENDISREVIVERSTFSGNSPSSGNGCNILGEAIGFTLQFCDLNRPAGTSSGAVNISEASAGSVIRCNRIEGGGYLLFGPDPKFNFTPISSLYSDPAFQTSHVYGNVFINGPTPPTSADSGTDNSTIIQIGDIFGTPGTHRTGTMHFHHNSVVVNSQRSSTALFSFSEPQAVVKASNNIVHCTQALGGGITLNLRKYHGDYTLGINWFRTGLAAGTGDGTMTGFASAITGTDPLVTWGTGALQNLSSCVDAATALPSGALAVTAQYASPASSVARAAGDLGAAEANADVTPFAQWLYDWFGSAGDGTADNDQDGAQDLLEYALGLDPTQHEPGWQPSVTRINGFLSMTVTKSIDATDVSFIIEVSDDLLNWQNGAPHTTTLIDTATTLQVRDDGTGPHRFIRLRVVH